MFKSALKEIFPAMAVSVTIYRFTTFTAGSYDGVSPSRRNNDLAIPVRAHVYAISHEDVLSSNGYYQIGDIKTKTLVDIVGYNNDPANVKQGDFMKYDGKNYVIKGIPEKAQLLGGRAETIATWRRV